MAPPRKTPPPWWLLGYLTQYQRRALLVELEKIGIDSDQLYAAANSAAKSLSVSDYRRLSKAWAVRQLRVRSSKMGGVDTL